MSSKTNEQHKTEVVQLGKKYVGTDRQSPIEIPIKLCNAVRAKILSWLAVQWPYHYNSNKENFVLLGSSGITKRNGSNGETIWSVDNKVVQSFELTKGQGNELNFQISGSGDRSESIRVKGLVDKETSQGRVLILQVEIEGKSKSRIVDCVLKFSKIEDYELADWLAFKDIRDPDVTFKTDTYKNCTFVSMSFLEAVTAIRLSRLIENRICPFFPICYGTSLNTFANSKNETNLYQSLWIENLKFSMYDVLKNEKRASVWYSQFLMACIGLQIAWYYYSFVHGDAHTENIRERVVSNDTFIWVMCQKNLLKIPTEGFIPIWIDYGRSVIDPFNGSGNLLLVSREYSLNKDANLAGLPFHNRSFDIFRLLTSVCDFYYKTIDPKDLPEFDKFFRRFTNIPSYPTFDIKAIANAGFPKTGPSKRDAMEVIPRQNCVNSGPVEMIEYLMPKFLADPKSLPEGIEPIIVPF